MDRNFSIAQTAAAAAATAVIYFVMLYFGTPIIQWGLELYSRWFVPERFGGGREVDNPGVLTALGRVLFLSTISAWVAVRVSARFFESAHVRAVSVLFAMAVAAWGAFLAYLYGTALEEITLKGGIAFLSVAFMVAPPLILAFLMWREESWL